MMALRFDSSISLLGALAAVAITIVLFQVPFPENRRRLRRAWLWAWGVMSLHFGLQSFQRAGWGMPLTGKLADGLLVLAILLFVDWALQLPLAASAESEAVVSTRRRAAGWAARAFALGLAVWVLGWADWRPVAQTVAFGVLPVAGGLAVLRLQIGSRLTRWVLALALICWGLGFIFAPWSWATWANLANGALVDVQTLISKVFCGLAMVLFAVDEQRALAESRRDYLADLYQNSPLWYHSVNTRGQVTEINQVALDFLGLPRERIVGHLIRDFSVARSSADLPAPEAVLDQVRQAGRLDGLEADFPGADGRLHTMRFFIRATFDRRGRWTGARSLLWDVTAEKQLQGQLLQSQKMEAIGTLTAGVAHDFNNLLTAILGQVELIVAKFRERLPGDCSARLDTIGEAGRRAADLVAQLLSFSRRQRVEMEPIDLSAILRGAGEMLRHGLPENIHVDIALTARPGTVQGNATQLQQVLLNLGVNARQALPERGGRLLLGLEDRQDFAPRGKPRGDWAVLCVSDNGAGMTPEVKSRIFEPFFTTKEQGKGTGLGLAIVYGIVQGHGGVISVESAPGHGARFEICLPFTPAATLAVMATEARR